jgi:opacity protein-like surface antigen
MTKTLILIALIFLAPTVLAQNPSSRGEIFGSFGGGQASDDEGSIGRGFDFGGGVGYRITPRIGVEGQVNRISYQRGFSSGGRFEGSAVFTTANLVYHFSKGRAQPYVFGGVGFVHHENRSQFDPAIVVGTRRANGFASNFGAGVKLFVSKHFSVRPEFRVLLGDTKGSGVEPPFSVARGSIGFSYHW